MNHAMNYALETRGLCKNFGAIQVTKSVDLKIEHGARHALIGPNGAGKTTLVNLCTGMFKPSSGAILLNGSDITSVSAQRRVGGGLVRTFQINTLFNGLTVAENLAIPVAQRLGRSWKPWGRSSGDAAVAADVVRLMDELNLLALASKKIADLAYGQRRLVEIAIAMALEPKVLLLDEPAAGIPNGESGMILDLLERLPDAMSIVFIEHDMNLVFRFARRISVLVEGAVLVEGSVDEIRKDQRVRDVYLGRRHHD